MNKNDTLLIRINSDLKKQIQEIATKNNVSVAEIINVCLAEIAKKGDLNINQKAKLKVYSRIPKKDQIDIFTIRKVIAQLVENSEYKEKINKVYLYGSFARGEETPNSDIDLRFETTNNISMFDIGNIRYFIKEKTGRDVDISNEDPDKLDPDFYAKIAKDEICIYDRTRQITNQIR